jgi:hypothetical protein
MSTWRSVPEGGRAQLSCHADEAARHGIADRIERFLFEHRAQCANAHNRISETPLYRKLMRREIPHSVWTPNDERLI